MDVAEELIGVAASALVWAGGAHSSRMCALVSLRYLPASWREHPVVGPLYRDYEARRATAGAWLRTLALYFVGVLAFFCTLVAADVRFVVQLAAVFVLAAYSVHASRARNRRRLSEFTDTYDLEPPPRIRWLRLWHVLSKFASSGGFLGLALFGARLVFAIA